MASRLCLKHIQRQYPSSLFSSSSKTHFSHTFKTPLHHLHTLSTSRSFQNSTSNLGLIRPNLHPPPRHFSSHGRNRGPHTDEEDDDDEENDELSECSEDEDDDEDGEEEEEEDDDEEDGARLSGATKTNRTYTVEETIEEAAAIGYKVIGPLKPEERPFKFREPYFAVVQLGSHQFKVSNGDTIYTERLKFCEVNDKLILNKVLMVGSKSQTIIGRPILPEAEVHAVVEEHALDAKVIIFKKKRRKNYRRTKGHRQELTRLRITDIQGIEKPEPVAVAA